MAEPDSSAAVSDKQLRSAELGAQAAHQRPLFPSVFKHFLIIPALLLSIYAAQAVWFIRTQSLTYDEPLHVFAGVEATRYGKFELSLEHPPLARVWMALPLRRDGSPQVRIDRLTGLATSVTDPQKLAWRARLPILFFGLTLGALVWAAARRLWSEGAANFALALFAFSPSLIAHFALATTDGAAVLMVFATAFQLMRWRDDPSWAQTVLLGVVLGLLLLAKLYTPPYLLLTLTLVLRLQPDTSSPSPKNSNWKAGLIMAATALLVLWAGYFFHISHLTVHNGTLRLTSPHDSQLRFSVPSSWHADFRLPAGEYFAGFVTALVYMFRGRSGYVMGHAFETSKWVYFPIVILLKWPIVVLLLTLITVLLLIRRRLSAPSSLALLLLFPMLAMMLALVGNVNLGERHILPAYPFVLVLAAGAWEAARSISAPRKRHIATALLLLGLGINAADALRYAPDYLSQLNVCVRPRESYRYVSDSNLDWGQGLIALRQYQQQHPSEQLHLAYFGSVNPEVYGIKAEPLREDGRASGTIVISATNLAGQYLRDPAAYHWVLQYPLRTILNHSLYVFAVPPNSGTTPPAN